MNVRDDGYCEDYFDGVNVPIILVIRDARTCHLNDGTSASVDHCRVGLVPDYLTCHCKLAAMDSSMLVVEAIQINFTVAPICIHYFHTTIVMTGVYINQSERIFNAFHVEVIGHSNSECCK